MNDKCELLPPAGQENSGCGDHQHDRTRFGNRIDHRDKCTQTIGIVVECLELSEVVEIADLVAVQISPGGKLPRVIDRSNSCGDWCKDRPISGRNGAIGVQVALIVGHIADATNV